MDKFNDMIFGSVHVHLTLQTFLAPFFVDQQQVSYDHRTQAALWVPLCFVRPQTSGNMLLWLLPKLVGSHISAKQMNKYSFTWIFAMNTTNWYCALQFLPRMYKWFHATNNILNDKVTPSSRLDISTEIAIRVSNVLFLKTCNKPYELYWCVIPPPKKSKQKYFENLKKKHQKKYWLPRFAVKFWLVCMTEMLNYCKRYCRNHSNIFFKNNSYIFVRQVTPMSNPAAILTINLQQTWLPAQHDRHLSLSLWYQHPGTVLFLV